MDFEPWISSSHSAMIIFWIEFGQFYAQIQQILSFHPSR
jgi:hypothetical protein